MRFCEDLIAGGLDVVQSSRRSSGPEIVDVVKKSVERQCCSFSVWGELRIVVLGLNFCTSEVSDPISVVRSRIYLEEARQHNKNNHRQQVWFDFSRDPLSNGPSQSRDRRVIGV